MNNNNVKKLSIKELKQKAREMDVDISKCLEKQEIVDLIEGEKKKREENGGTTARSPSSFLLFSLFSLLLFCCCLVVVLLRELKGESVCF